MLRDNARVGFTTEMYVASLFAEQGYVVSLPLTSCRYDWIVDTGISLYRVQVKKAAYRKYSYHLAFNGRPGKSKPYEQKDFDYLCVRTAPDDIFVIPMAEIVKDGKIQPSLVFSRNGRFSQYLNNFTLPL